MALIFGLSPLARGTRLDISYMGLLHRFIPAGAGNTSSASKYAVTYAVYPRWRGEHHQHSRKKAAPFGLSPLARGTRSCRENQGRGCRFIPAGAGNTCKAISGAKYDSVYPRWRGEHAIFFLTRRRNLGLSPLARGTPHRLLLPYTLWRFIPAGAGNTDGIANRAKSITVYPRWRGEHGNLGAATVDIGGLSPLARGTRLCVKTARRCRRFIPAGAGNTLKVEICFITLFSA